MTICELESEDLSFVFVEFEFFFGSFFGFEFLVVGGAGSSNRGPEAAVRSCGRVDLVGVDLGVEALEEENGDLEEGERERDWVHSSVVEHLTADQEKFCFGYLFEYALLFVMEGLRGSFSLAYENIQDARSAVKRYNNVQLDGKPMKIEIVGTNIATPAMPPAANGSFGNLHMVPRRTCGGGNGGRGFGRGRGWGRGLGEKLLAEDLDADLKKYHSEAMQIN
ncbi:THO complex subunit 4A [Camellia lanceoleosa]|uniref:THO complex subunit 4A n=1 Tax=Camellia lanceoleosa TaxID=1840588 RepID=A0ACC0HJD2_9ERIC|nr:THO complex subunit 4A [Camellia lanceoleosa]